MRWSFSSRRRCGRGLHPGKLIVPVRFSDAEKYCQTIAVLRQSWKDGLRPILVVNKLDRLITELKLSTLEAYHHISRLIEQVNAVMGSFFAGERMEDDLRWREEHERRLALKKEAQADDVEGDIAEFLEKDDEGIYFAPDRGNVVFASAIDGWGFRVGKFAQLFSLKLGMKEATLRRVLWGDFFLEPKTKRVITAKHLRGRALKPLFVQVILENIWAVYDAVVLNPCVSSHLMSSCVKILLARNSEKVAKIVTTLNLKLTPREVNSKDSRSLLSMIFSRWLSLSTCIIQTVIDVVPAPTIAQASRIPKMLNPELHEAVVQPKNKTERDLFGANFDPSAVISAYVSKMFAVPARNCQRTKGSPRTPRTHLILARLANPTPLLMEKKSSWDSRVSTQVPSVRASMSTVCFPNITRHSMLPIPTISSTPWSPLWKVYT